MTDLTPPQNDLDLFGEKIVHLHKPTTTGRPRKTGYAAEPGTGPAGMTCKRCEHYYVTSATTAKSYRKCSLMRSVWTGGPGTDIKASAPACALFKESTV